MSVIIGMLKVIDLVQVATVWVFL